MEGENYILQVDDEEIYHFITQRVPKYIQTDLPVYCAYNGQQALKQVEANTSTSSCPPLC